MTDKPTSVHHPSSSVTEVRGGRCLLIAHVENGRIIRLD
jgi:hypothetical protein